MKAGNQLTGLPEREGLRRALTSPVAAGDNVAVAHLDLDSFHGVNTEFGHEVGDRVLQVLATLLESEAQAAGGTAYHFSGDEFALLLPSHTLEQAFLRMEGFRARVQGSADRFGLPDSRAMTVTIGVAQCPRDGKDVEALFKAADAALLAAKEQGRNAVGLPPNEEMVMKTCYYPAGTVRKLKSLAERASRKESVLLREALDDLLRKYDTRQA
jgi:diguanylate cyclase